METLRSWSHGKDKHLPFGIQVIWRELIDHIADCYFCMVNVKGFNKKNKHSIPISKLQFSFERPVPHVVDAPKPVFNYLPYLEDDTLRYSSTSTDDDMSADSFSKSCRLLPLSPSLSDQAEINNSILDLNLPKQSSELLASRLQEKHLVHPGTNIAFYRNRARMFSIQR